jgi:hypothetical protein
MVFLKLAAFSVASLALSGVGICALGMVVAAWRVPGLPLRIRLIPFAVLSEPEWWTPTIRSLHQWGVWCGLVTLGALLAFFCLVILSIL